jgi:hypothetical protein
MKSAPPRLRASIALAIVAELARLLALRVKRHVRDRMLTFRQLPDSLPE